MAAAAATATATATATVAALQEKQGQELGQYGAVRPRALLWKAASHAQAAGGRGGVGGQERGAEGRASRAPLFSSQMGAAQSFNSQFLQHGGPRGPSVPSSMNPASVGGLMGPSGMSSAGMSPARAAGMAPFYAGQRLSQHGYPGPPQAQPLPRQGVKRAYASEVSVGASP